MMKLLKFRNKRKISRRILTKNYDDSLIANYITRKTQDLFKSQSSLKFSVSNYRYFVPFAFLSHENEIRVLDFGGGAGDHFYSMINTIKHNIKNWTVVETNAMVVSATQIVFDKRLIFETSLSNLIDKEFDLVIASSSIQYTYDPLRILGELIDIKPKYLFVTRMPVWDFPTMTVFQKSPLSSNGPGRQLYEYDEGIVEYELTILNQKLFESRFSGKFELVFRCLENEGVHKIDGKMVNQYGYLFRRIELD